jgi:ribosomal protein L21E
MKFKMIVFALALLFAGALVSSAQDPNMGTWKLYEAKSKFAKGAQKNHTVVYELSGDMVKVTVDGTTADGNVPHNEWTGKFDGKYYEVTDDSTSGTRAYGRINSRTCP